MVRKTVDAYSGLDLAYNNAGMSHPPQMPIDVTDELFRRVFEINVYGVFSCCREQIRVFLQQGQAARSSSPDRWRASRRGDDGARLGE